MTTIILFPSPFIVYHLTCLTCLATLSHVWPLLQDRFHSQWDIHGKIKIMQKITDESHFH